MKRGVVMLDLKGKWVLVTGASRGLGRLAAKLMAEQGCNLLLQSRSIEHTSELEKEINRLKAENERLLGSMGGRKKHDDAWMASYNDFAVKYDNGMTIMEIVSEGNISRRTAYRYLKYFRSINGNT